MVIVYRVPVALPEETRLVFEAHGVRLRPGDEVVLQAGERPVQTRELPQSVIQCLVRLPVVYAEAELGEPSAPRGQRRGRRASDRPAFPRLVPDDAEDQLA